MNIVTTVLICLLVTLVLICFKFYYSMKEAENKSQQVARERDNLRMPVENLELDAVDPVFVKRCGMIVGLRKLLNYMYYCNNIMYCNLM